MSWIKTALLLIVAEATAGAINQSVAAPLPAQSDSRWNVLAYGGKGEMHGAPLCNALPFFSASPISLDFDSDFFGAKPADLVTQARVIFLGAMAERRVFEVMLTVHRRAGAGPAGSDVNSPPAMKILLVERRPSEFCDIYEQQYTYDPTNETDQASILDISGRKVLKTYETDMHTWYLEYWAMDANGPLRLKTDALYTAIDSVSPAGALPFRGPLNLSGSEFTADVYRAESDHPLFGRAGLKLRVNGDAIIAVSKKWLARRDLQ